MCIHPDLLLRQVRTLRRLARLHVTFDDGFRNITSVVPQLCDLGVLITLFVCSGYADLEGAPLLIPELETDDPHELEQLRTMSWDELRALAQGGVTIGAHTISHPHLTGLADADLARELQESKRRVEDEIGVECRLFAYPYGEHDPRVRAAARAAGYERAFALRRGSSGDPFATPRVDLYRRHSRLRTLSRAAPFLLPRNPSSRTPDHLPKQA
jgi:peptidoglycan/xylan/chitin deacetylase (PgdA/CDA1 family)